MRYTTFFLFVNYCFIYPLCSQDYISDKTEVPPARDAIVCHYSDRYRFHSSMLENLLHDVNTAEVLSIEIDIKPGEIIPPTALVDHLSKVGKELRRHFERHKKMQAELDALRSLNARLIAESASAKRKRGVEAKRDEDTEEGFVLIDS